MNRLTPEQCRAARALLDWPQARLAVKAGLSEGTVRDFETGKSIPVGEKLVALRSAFDLAGIAFLGDGEAGQGGPGVRLKMQTVARTDIHDGEAGIIQNNDM